MRILVTIFVSLLLLGCGEAQKQAGHSHLWTPGKKQHVWSYERVIKYSAGGSTPTEPKDFLGQEMQEGDKAIFECGALIECYDGKLKVQNEKIDFENVFVEADGSFRNGFIKTK